MRAALVILLLVLTIGLSVWLFGGGDGQPPPLGGPADPNAPAKSTPDPTPNPGSPGAAIGEAPRAVASRAEVNPDAVADLADRPTACLLVVDHDGHRPIAGAVIRRMQDGVTIGFSDARGLVELPLKEREQLVIATDDYLLRMAPTRLGSTVTEPQQVTLVRDRWSCVRRFEFRAEDGSARDDVFTRFRSVASGADPTAFGPPAENAVERRAWTEHTMLAGHPSCGEVAVQLGSFAVGRVHRLGDGATVRFAVPGEFDLEAATVDGLVRTQRIAVAAAPSRAAPPTVRVVLRAGDFVLGRVLGSSAQPLAGATLTQQGGDPLGLRCTSGPDGAFAFGPLAAGAVTLLVRHAAHEPIAFGPVSSNEKQARITLRELAGSTLRGRVRRRPTLAPIAGATVAWSATANAPVTATTAADGTFQLAASGTTAGRLLVSAPGCIAYEELVAPGAAFADYDVLPSSMTERVEQRLTAMLSGVVFDASSRPAAGVGVRWIPDQRSQPSGQPGRRTISGNVLLLPLSTTTRDDGSFELETQHFGAGRLVVVGSSSTDQGVRTEAIAGVAKAGHRLQQQ